MKVYTPEEFMRILTITEPKDLPSRNQDAALKSEPTPVVVKSGGGLSKSTIPKAAAAPITTKPEKISVSSETSNQEPTRLQRRKDWAFMCKEM
jgi:hypothetical protein